jgi:hypothetical protein
MASLTLKEAQAFTAQAALQKPKLANFQACFRGLRQTPLLHLITMLEGQRTQSSNRILAIVQGNFQQKWPLSLVFVIWNGFGIQP